MPHARVEPGPGQESVWDYPRPPRLETVPARVTIEFAGELVVDTTDSVRVLETSHPPVYYVPRSAVRAELVLARGVSWCEFKGEARYLDLRVDERVAPAAAWTYPQPAAGYESLRDRIAVYPGRMDRCTVGGETVTPQEGDFYGGWITSRVVGPFKGGPGSLRW
jgi:uncharacterized protein (DUF427 family)